MNPKKASVKEDDPRFENSKNDKRVNMINSFSFLYKTPSWVMAVITVVISTIIMIIVGSLLQSFDKESIIAYSLNALLISAGCFIIIRVNPKSIWYIPFICNAALILSALIEENFWVTNMWIPIVSGWVLTIVVSLVAAYMRTSET